MSNLTNSLSHVIVVDVLRLKNSLVQLELFLIHYRVKTERRYLNVRGEVKNVENSDFSL